MIIEITNIVAGLILAMGILPSIPAIGDSLEKVAKWLGRNSILWLARNRGNRSWINIGSGSSDKRTCYRQRLSESG
jgi:hypothetical protein